MDSIICDADMMKILKPLLIGMKDCIKLLHSKTKQIQLLSYGGG